MTLLSLGVVGKGRGFNMTAKERSIRFVRECCKRDFGFAPPKKDIVLLEGSYRDNIPYEIMFRVGQREMIARTVGKTVFL